MDAIADKPDEAEARLLAAALTLAPRMGWTRALAEAAARQAGLSPGEAELIAPGGARDLAALASAAWDATAMARLAAVDPTSLKVRERIRAGVAARLRAVAGDEAAARRLAAWLLLPSNAALGVRLAWRSADLMWRWAGDVSTDENHYTKRALLAAILTSTTVVRLMVGKAAAERHLDRAIAGVMAFEKGKAGAARFTDPVPLARALGRLRHGGV